MHIPARSVPLNVVVNIMVEAARSAVECSRDAAAAQHAVNQIDAAVTELACYAEQEFGLNADTIIDRFRAELPATVRA